MISYAALDPSIKLAYAEQEWQPEYFERGCERLEQVVCFSTSSSYIDLELMPLEFDKYASHLTLDHPQGVKPAILPPPGVYLDKYGALSHLMTPATTAVKTQYGHSWMQAAVQARKEADCRNASPRAELAAYLSAPLAQEVQDVVAWWGVSIVLLSL